MVRDRHVRRVDDVLNERGVVVRQLRARVSIHGPLGERQGSGRRGVASARGPGIERGISQWSRERESAAHYDSWPGEAAATILE